MSSPKPTATVAGLASICLWATTVGVSRVLTESLGPMTAGAGIYAVGGVLGCLWFYRTAAARVMLRQLPPRYLYGCGAVFVIYTVALYGAIGLAAGRQQVLEVAIINYLWPGLTLVLAIPLLKRRPAPLFAVGVVAAFAGVVVATTPPGGWSAAGFIDNLRFNSLPYALALVAAVLWALYSNLVRRWAGRAPGAGIPLFVLVSGVVMLVLRTAMGETPHWSATMVGLTAFMAIGPALLAYILWDIAMRRGNIVLVASCAYFTPVLSTFTSCLVLTIRPPAPVLIGAAMVVAGAALCNWFLR